MGGSAPFSGRGEGSPSKTKLLASRPTSIPSGILIHPTIWPQQIWAENWGAVPLWGRWSWVPIQHNVARAEAYLHAKFHLPSNRLATIHQRYRQTDRQTTVRYHRVNRFTNGCPKTESSSSSCSCSCNRSRSSCSRRRRHSSSSSRILVDW